jgi:hypothetical protein
MKPFVIIIDYNFYLDTEDDIKQWANQCTPGWERAGMILEFTNEEDRLAFLLRWN